MSESSKSPTILVIDDDDEVRYSLQRVLSSRGYAIAEASSGESGIEAAENLRPEVILLDNRMTGISGLETLQHLKSRAPASMVILMTAYGNTQTAIEAMKFGAFDYVIKPFDLKKITQLVESALASYRDLDDSQADREPLLNSDDYKEGIVGMSGAMQEVFKMIGQVATSDVTVMITGESGTGKELVARAIYQHSHRSAKPFIAVNCAAIPDNLIESELFGHEKGSFTGATNQRMGKFELCDEGTIFLDEIGDMSLTTQTKILRALQEGEIQRVGGSETIKVDVRMIAATNKNLEALVESREFREDLYYRLNVVRLRLPALRERLEDIPLLVDFMIQRLAKDQKIRVKGISPDARKVLTSYAWPGNVRELENVVFRSAVVAQGETILVKDLPSDIVRSARADGPAAESLPQAMPAPVQDANKPIPPATPAAPSAEKPAGHAPESVPPDQNLLLGKPRLSLDEAWDQVYQKVRRESDRPLLPRVEAAIIQRVLDETGGNQIQASKLLGITRGTLRKRIDEYGLQLRK